MLTKVGIIVFRIAGGVASIVVGAALLGTCSTEKPLGIALVALGVFILFHLGIETWFQAIRKGCEPVDEGGTRDFAAIFVSTSGVILGLLAVFGDEALSLTLKVGIIALVTDILVGIVLIGVLLSGPAGDDQRGWNLIRYVFHLALWALSLGLLCIAMALLYR